MGEETTDRIGDVVGAALAIGTLAALAIALIGRGVAPAAAPDVAAGPFQVLSAELSFDDGPARALSADETVRAAVKIAYVGSGEIEGVFEVADAASSAGSPVYRVLRRVRRSVGPGEHVRIQGPKLPTTRLGAQRLRFRLVGAAEDAEIAAAVYAVDAPLAVPAAAAP